MTRRRCFAIMRSTVYELCVNAQPAKENPMLWFKNLMIYRLNRDIRCPQTTEKQLAAFSFSPCGSQDMAKTGWVSPMGSRSEALTHVNNGQILICARKEEKILPSPVIKQSLEAKIEKLEAEQQRKLKRPKRTR